MDILIFTWYKIGILGRYGVKHLQFSYFISNALTIGLSIFYIIYYIDFLNEFPLMNFSCLITIALHLPLSNATNLLVSYTIPMGSLLAL